MTATPEHDDRHDLGLQYDVGTLLTRRRALGLFGGAALAVTVAGCASDGATSAGTATTTAAAPPSGGPGGPPPAETGTTTATATDEIPEETAGPYPGDGSNGPNALTESGVVRSDIRSSFGTGSATAAGVPLTVRLTVLDVANGQSSPYAGAAVYLWHCDSAGRYSMYSDGVEDENYLRGVQAAGADGVVAFTSIYPAAYDGRWPHIHFEIYPDLASATSADSKLRTTQLALPEDVSRAVYATDEYSGSLDNLDRTSLDTDNVFRDGYSLQLATVTGDVAAGYTATLNVPV